MTSTRSRTLAAGARHRSGPGLVALLLAALVVVAGCGVEQSELPDVAGSPAAAVQAPALPEPTVTVTASVAPEPSVADEPAQADPAPAPADDEPGSSDEAGSDEAGPPETAPGPTAAPLPAPAIDAADEQISFSFPGVGGTVLEAMDADGLAFEAKGSGENSFITAVGGQEADDSDREYWALYVNGVYAQLGAGSQQASPEDTITWRLERY